MNLARTQPDQLFTTGILDEIYQERIDAYTAWKESHSEVTDLNVRSEELEVLLLLLLFLLLWIQI